MVCYRFSLFAFALLFSLAGIQCTPYSTAVNSSNPVLLISIDGFMNEYLDRNDTPNFDRFMENGVRAEHFIPVFPTKTFPTHWSLVTGLYVENHGVIANSFYDYELDGRFSYGPPADENDERWWGGEPIWITAEKQSKTAATFFWPGSDASFGGVRPSKWVQYDSSVPDSARIDSIMAWMDPSGEVQADFGALYFSFVDTRGHTFGPASPETDEAVKEADALLGYLFRKMETHGLSESLNLIITSDHGMAELSGDKVIFLEELIDLNDVEMLDWSPVALIRPKEGKTEAVYQALKAKEENYTVYLRDEIPERFRFKNHYRIPEVIMIADISYTITNRPFFENRGISFGNHGFDNLAPEMRTLFIAAGPDFQAGMHSPAFDSVHIYELMCRLLGIDPAPNDGDLERVIHLLR